MFICHASRQRLITRVAPPCWQMIGSWHLVIPRVYKNPCCDFRSHLMKTLDWSVETLGREWNSTELCIHLLKPLFHSSQKPIRKLAASAFKYCDWMKVLAASPILQKRVFIPWAARKTWLILSLLVMNPQVSFVIERETANFDNKYVCQTGKRTQICVNIVFSDQYGHKLKPQHYFSNIWSLGIIQVYPGTRQISWTSLI